MRTRWYTYCTLLPILSQRENKNQINTFLFIIIVDSHPALEVDMERALDSRCSVLVDVVVLLHIIILKVTRTQQKTTYNDVLSGFESADIDGVVAVVHLPQDGNHASNKTPLKEKKKIPQIPNSDQPTQEDLGTCILLFPNPVT